MFDLYERIDKMLWYLVTNRKISYTDYVIRAEQNVMEYEAFTRRIYAI
jgi:hypothetical protein